MQDAGTAHAWKGVKNLEQEGDMSILIPGMKMPTACISCPFMVSRDGDDCILQSDEANASFMSWEQMKAGCPLVELPSHGRLGDLDALAAKDNADYEDAMASIADVSTRSIVCKIHYAVQEMIAEAETILPAGPEGGDAQ